MDDKSFQTQTSNNGIVTELKKAGLLKDEEEKLKAYSIGFEALGDWYVRESDLLHEDILTKHRMRLKAVCLYNLALASRGDQHTLVSKIQLIDEGILQAAGSQASPRTADEYIREIEDYKHDLNAVREIARQHLSQIDIASIEVKTIYQNIAVGLRKLVTKMIEKCFVQMPPPDDCQYSIIVLGSIAREEATPYSDLEWAILLGEDNDGRKEYFRRITELVWIKILNLQETTSRMMDIQELDWFFESESPCRKGFSFDGQMISGCHTPLGNCHHTASKIRAIEQSDLLTAEEKTTQIQKIKDGEYELIGTPKELSKFQTQRWETKRGFCTVLSTAAPIISNSEDLLQAYEEKMRAIWRSPVESNPKQELIQKRSLAYLSESVERFQFRGGYFGKETHYFDAKYHLYRLPNMLLDHLSSYFGVLSKNLWDRIESLFGEKGLAPLSDKTIALKRVVSQVLGLRLRAYLKKGYRDDHILMFDPESPEKNEAVLKKYLGVNEDVLLQIYSELIELQWRMEEFIKNEGKASSLGVRYGDTSDAARGEVYSLLLNYSKAALSFESVIRQMIAEHGTSSLSVIGTVIRLGNMYTHQAKYSDAEATFKQVIGIKSGISGSKCLWVADALIGLGVVYTHQSRFLEAEEAIKEAFGIKRAILGLEHLSVAETLANLGNLYQCQVKPSYSEAITAYKVAIRIISEKYGSEHISVAGILNNLGNVHRILNHFHEAKTAFEMAIRIKKDTFGPQHVTVAVTLSNLGALYDRCAIYAQAIAKFNEAKRILIATYGSDHPEIATVLNNLGVSYRAQARYPEAIAALDEAIWIRKGKFGAQHVTVAETLNNLGNVYQSLAFYPKAIAVYQEAIEIMTVTRSTEHSIFVALQCNLAAVYDLQGRYSEAIAAYLKAKRITMDNGSHADIMNSLGLVYATLGRYPEAIIEYTEAIRIRSKISISHPSLANILYNLGLVFIEERDFNQARNLFRDASVIYTSAQCPVDVKKALMSKIDSYIREGNIFLLRDPMDVLGASACYQHAPNALDPGDSTTHETLADYFAETNQLTAVLEHYRILIRLAPENASAHHNLACYVHAWACIEQSKGEDERALDYFKEAEGYFEQAIQLTSHDGVCTDAGVCTKYAQFLWKHRVYYDNKKIIALLQQAIGLNQMENELSYRKMERAALDQYLQSLLDQEKQLSLKAVYLAHYLLIQVYCATNQLPAAQALCRSFQTQCKADNEIYEFTQVELCAQISDFMEADPDNAKHYEEQLRQQSLANEKQQRLHTKLVEGSQAAIERCIASQLHESKQSTHSPTLSLRLSGDSPILAGESPNKIISEDEEIKASLNQNL